MTKRIKPYYVECVVSGDGSVAHPPSYFPARPKPKRTVEVLAELGLAGETLTPEEQSQVLLYPAKEPAVLRGPQAVVIWIGAKWSDAHLKDDAFAKSLGIFNAEAATAKRPGVSKFLIKNYSDLGALGYVGEVSFDLEHDDLLDDPSWGDLYHTYVPYSTGLSLTMVSQLILGHYFKSPNGQVYKVVAGSLSVKHSRKTVSRIG